MNNIIINLKGGIGNQMFQYAFGKKISIVKSVPFKLDISGYKNDKLRQYRLSYFNIEENIATDTEIQKTKYPFGIISKINRFVQKKILKKVYTDYHPELLKKNIEYFDGYFQSELYFKDIREQILKDFTIKKPSHEFEIYSKEIDSSPNATSIHIRRGDYAKDEKTKKEHGLCPISYYEEASKIILQKDSNSTFFIFSDDIGWAKENLKLNSPTKYISLKDYEEILLMSKCKNNIIANSSFSWWGAWLNQNTNRIVLAPKHWLANPRKTKKLHPNIIPQSWIKI